MLFNSFHYLAFFPIVSLVYFLLPFSYGRVWLFLASCYFYMVFKPAYILILFLLIGIDFFCALRIERYEAEESKKRWLWLSLSSNVLLLCFFKYLNFLIENIVFVGRLVKPEFHIPHLDIILPIGLSFHTFQSMAYILEVYYGRQKAERNLLTYSLYVLFFPQMVAGPIERPKNLLYQFREKLSFNTQRINSGLRLILWGLFKKIAVADQLSGVIDPVFSDPIKFQGPVYFVALVSFSIQIYCDFSGYSDMAIGSARVLGFRLMRNFNNPYFAKSVPEFWNRWHISLTTWFRDYLYTPLAYLPLGKYRMAPINRMFAVIAVFLISGLWHGANWTYVIWGGINGVYLATSVFTATWRDGISRYFRLEKVAAVLNPLKVVFTFFLITFSWIFFRANTVTDAFMIIRRLGTGWSDVRLNSVVAPILYQLGYYVSRTPLEWGVLCVLIFVVLRVEVAHSKWHIGAWLDRQRRATRWTAYYVFILAILFFSIFETPKNFIYFQF